jgi:4'-phosphopantetheinyl transferase
MGGNSSTNEALPAGEAHLWYAHPDKIRDADALRRCDALMTPEERARGARFIPDAARHRHLVTRALVRCVLSRYADVAPGAWRFVENAYGRPEVDPVCDAPGLRFNLSHADGLIVCLVARNMDVGVDVEDTSRVVDYLGIGTRFFSPREATALAAAPEARRAERFFDYWTLKESYIKARGMGLALPLAAFSFDLDGQGTAIAFEPPIEDDPVAWQFDRLRIGRHTVATAIRGADTPVVLRVREMVPG